MKRRSSIASAGPTATFVLVFAVTLSACDTGGSTFSTVTITPSVVDAGLTMGAGEVLSDPQGIDCAVAADGSVSGACEAVFDPSLGLTLTATAAPPAVFAAWVDTASGDSFSYEESAGFGGSGTRTNPIAFSVDSGRTLSVSATFVVEP